MSAQGPAPGFGFPPRRPGGGEAAAPVERRTFAEPAPTPRSFASTQRRLEAGEIVVLPQLAFDLGDADPARYAAMGDGKAKHVSFNPLSGELRGATGDDAARAWLTSVLEAYARWALAIVREAAPDYAQKLGVGKTSFRPRPADHAMSARKDDRRLHVDAFPAQPVQGRRILRVFRNVNASGEPRVWQAGEPFACYAARFLPRASSRRSSAVPAWALQAVGITRGRRTAYDTLMLALHDAAKADDAYQAEAPRRTLSFPPGATWLVFSDAVPHAAVRGRFALEQTFFLPIEAMVDPEASPLRILERMTGRRLV
jgi:hypothetical protein